MKTAIVTDTNSGITIEEAEMLGIYLLPMPVIIDGNSYLEGIDIKTENLYKTMEEEHSISTSQPSPDSVTKLWDTVLKQGYDEIVHIPMTSGLSGSCQTAVMLAGDYPSKVLVVDNRRISITQRESVLEAVRMAAAGYSAKEIKTCLEKNALQASIYLTVESLKYLKQGGRLSPSAAMLGTILNIKPVLSIQGEQIEAFAKIRGIKNCEKKMAEAIQNDIDSRFASAPKEKISINVAGSLQKPDEIEDWKNTIQTAFPDYMVEYFALPCSIAVHVGPGCLGIAVCVSEH